MTYFVMLRNGLNRPPLPMVDADNRTPMLFESRTKASQVAAENILGRTYGFRVYSWDL